MSKEAKLKLLIRFWQACFFGGIALIVFAFYYKSQPSTSLFKMSVDERSKIEGCCENLQTIGQALDEYLAQNPDQYPKGGIVGPDLSDLAPENLAALPVCPANTASTYKVLYGPWADNVGDRDDYYQIWCQSNHGAGAGFPRYDKPNGFIRAFDDYKVPTAQ